MQTVPPEKIPGEILHRSPPKKALALWERASSLEARHQFLEALNTYREIAALYPDNAIAPRALHRAGRILADREQWNDALAFYTYAANSYPQWNGLPELYLDMTKAYLMTGKGDEALKASLKASNKAEKNLYAGLAYVLKGQDGKAIFSMDQYISDPQVTSNPEALLKASELAARILTPEMTNNYLKKPLPESLRIFLHCVLALQEISLGRTEQGRKRLQYLRETTSAQNPMSPLIEKIARKVAAEEVSPELGQANPGKLGLMVPLHGEFAIYGRSILQGASVALERWNRDHPYDPVELVVYDTSTYENASEKPVFKLLKEDKVIALIGPLGTKAVNRLIEEGYAGSVLVVALIPDEPRTETTPFYIRMLPGLTESLDLLVKYAVENLGVRSFGVLYPSDNFGEKALKAFNTAVDSHGGEIASAVSYPPQSVDLEAYIRNLEKQTTQVDKFNTGFEALFLPDTIRAVSTIVPQLFYYGITGIPLLGSHLWDHPELPNLANGYLEGAYYVTAFSTFTKDPSLQEFISDFRNLFGTEPELLHAIGYDALSLVLDIRSSLSQDERTRTGMISRARGFRPAHSITGIIEIEDNGHLQREYKIMTITNNTPVQVLP